MLVGTAETDVLWDREGCELSDVELGMEPGFSKRRENALKS